ncbi:GtrA family protein [Microvirga zambiensis]|uniref:GtrA family protein n=1 Tax=Microvirga zambiensis TaxID=1402137 RepID=UPI00191FAA8D|nr:GtrA family protein [Microvirga zambiensis]
MTTDVLRRFTLFLVAGLLNTAVGYSIYALLIMLSLIPELALLVATGLGLIFNFYSTGKIAFAGATKRYFLRFVAVYGAVYLLNASTLRILIMNGLDPLLSQVMLLPMNVILTFIALRAYVFQENAR